MNKKNIRKSLRKRLDNWFESITDENVRMAAKNDAIVTGGAFVSLLNNEEPNDLDIYFRTLETCELVAKYYATKWEELHPNKSKVEVEIVDNRVQCKIRSAGAVMEDEENGIDDNTEPFTSENEDNPLEQNPEIEKPKYRPRYISTNAITLSDKIQIVIRFWGSVEDIHKNYDFVHTTCSYDYHKDEVVLPEAALLAIMNKELIYQGSKYPLCSIIRTRKFIQRGWTINAGQYLKMALQLNDLDLKNFDTFKDQLTGVDSAYFNALIDIMSEKSTDGKIDVDNSYIIEIINKIF